jgi:hypothetical protein
LAGAGRQEALLADGTRNRVATTGESVRLAQATSGHGVTPLLEAGNGQPNTEKRRLPKTTR